MPTTSRLSDSLGNSLKGAFIDLLRHLGHEQQENSAAYDVHSSHPLSLGLTLRTIHTIPSLGLREGTL